MHACMQMEYRREIAMKAITEPILASEQYQSILQAMNQK